jgi:hypothetical protein
MFLDTSIDILIFMMKTSILFAPILFGLSFLPNPNGQAEILADVAVPTAISQASPATKTPADPQACTAVRGSKISLIKPDGFTDSSTFPGFQQESSGASIVVTEIPGPYSKVTAGFNAATLKTRGITLVSKENIQIEQYQGLLLQVNQSLDSSPFSKWITVFGDEQETVIVVATFPKDTAAKLSRSLKNTVLSAKWSRDKVVDPFADLKFGVTGTPNLKFAKRILNGLFYSKGGTFPLTAVNDPFLVVSQSISKVIIGDRQRFAKQRIGQVQQVKNLKIGSIQPISIGGLSGYEIVANATDIANNQPTTVYQVMLFEEQTYYIIQGLVGNSSQAKYLPEFQKIAISFRKK